jgi:peptidyl-prolyl cis-trans isomerase A (cyclophilin A)/peptidyl-prolyl cis-trans isomerase B (cyclophilin B)
VSILLAQATPAAGPSDLTVTLAADKSDYIIGEEIQAEVTLTNGGDKNLDVAELVFEERSLSFNISFEAAPGKTRQYLYSIVKPDPHLVDRVGPTRVTLKPKKSITGLFRIPTLKTGPLSLTAVYKGGEKEVSSAALSLKVAAQADGSSRLAAAVSTSKGDFQIDLLPEEAPNNVSSFVMLAHRGFYNNMNFHRIIKGGWIQTGCPYDLGFGHAGYAVKAETEPAQTVVHEAGTVAMSQNLKNNYTGSQFFIDLKRQESHDKKFTIIGRVPESRMEVVRQIGSVETDKNTDRPLKEEIRLKEIKIIVVK